MAQLLLPSQVLDASGTDNQDEYSLMVYKNIMTKINRPGSFKDNQTPLFALSFSNDDYSNNIVTTLLKRIESAFEEKYDIDQYFNILPPLFVRSNKEEIIELTDDIYLILFKTGEVIPVIVQINDDLLMVIKKIYSVVSDQYVNTRNIELILFTK